MRSCICTFTGKQFYPLQPTYDTIDIRDIAHALSNMPRFAGHTEHFYSVAQHSVWVSEHCDPRSAKYGLLHDASEAYILDMPSPIKDKFDNYRDIETHLMSVILNKFGLDPKDRESASVKVADHLALMVEYRDLMPHPEWLGISFDDIDGIETLFFESHKDAERLFLNRYEELWYGV